MGMLSYVKNEINVIRERSRDQIRLGSITVPQL